MTSYPARMTMFNRALITLSDALRQRRNPAQHDPPIAVVSQYVANGGAVSPCESAPVATLVEQRLEEVVIGAVDHHHRCAAQRLGGEDPSEPATDDDELVHGSRLRRSLGDLRGGLRIIAMYSSQSRALTANFSSAHGRVDAAVDGDTGVRGKEIDSPEMSDRGGDDVLVECAMSSDRPQGRRAW